MGVIAFILTACPVCLSGLSVAHSRRSYIDPASAAAGTQYLRVSLDTVVTHKMAK